MLLLVSIKFWPLLDDQIIDSFQETVKFHIQLRYIRVIPSNQLCITSTYLYFNKFITQYNVSCHIEQVNSKHYSAAWRLQEESVSLLSTLVHCRPRKTPPDNLTSSLLTDYNVSLFFCDVTVKVNLNCDYEI